MNEATRSRRTRASPPVTLAAFVPLVLALGLLAGCSSTPRYASTLPEPKPITKTLGATDDLRIANGALESGDLDLAQSLYEKALKHDPKSVEASLGLGDCLYQQDDLEHARLAYEHAVALAPDTPAPQLALGRIAIRQRRFDDAAQRYRALLAKTPNDPAASAGLGTVLDLEGQHAQAEAVYRGALALHPDSQALRIDLGLSLVLSNQPREGANVLLDVAGIPDAPPQARQDLALAYGLLGNDDAAQKILLTDLPKASVEDNLRYYARARAALQSQPQADAAIPVASAVSQVPGAAVPLAPTIPSAAPATNAAAASGQAPGSSAQEMTAQSSIPARLTAGFDK
ncbi:hypothetical protein CY652_06135 [Burkholderia sp. WAC0059]|uniref:tetratricopeptide repeat protein n=1 Tax=Burkholderia sp. WAC0059 TaxID=2066022 RepID=UPI000C7ED32C|nr:tetratricopeptide repeat protein [Burkholderia sp. WAC0059]PLZ03381.1 hypothetical protein CY652_06135 [Burkholderia sp. WAC0059]